MRRGKFLVGEPFFLPGAPFTLGRRGSVPAGEGDLALVLPGGRGRARVLEVLGRPDEVVAVVAALAGEAGLRAPWPAPVGWEVADLPREPLPPEPGRVDLRGLVTFTVDPPDARDHDDALSIVREAGGPRAYVHIADVSAFVAPGGAVDRAAAERATSVYLPGLVAPMLPAELSNGLCSLHEARDRYAVTVELGAGRPLFYRSLIRSDARLSYPQVERILAGEERVAPAVAEALREADGLAAELRERRLARGAVTVDAAELELRFDERGVAAARLAGESRAHVLVEELMLRANEAVAALLADAREPCLFRVHAPPDPAALDALAARLAALDVPTPPQPELHTPADAAAFAAAVADRVRAYVAGAGRGRHAFPALVLRALQRARYSAQNGGHSALASRAYCHFTSPIRRYPDLVVHRALLHHVGAAGARQEGLDPVAEHCSEREREADRLERRGDAIGLAFLLERRLREVGFEEVFAGEVTGVIEGAAFVRFAEVFEGLLPARALADDRYDVDELGIALVGRASGRRLRLGDRVEVEVEHVDRALGRVRLTTAGRAS